MKIRGNVPAALSWSLVGSAIAHGVFLLWASFAPAEDAPLAEEYLDQLRLASTRLEERPPVIRQAQKPKVEAPKPELKVEAPKPKVEPPKVEPPKPKPEKRKARPAASAIAAKPAPEPAAAALTPVVAVAAAGAAPRPVAFVGELSFVGTGSNTGRPSASPRVTRTTEPATTAQTEATRAVAAAPAVKADYERTLKRFLARNVRYPEAARRAGLEGSLILSVTVSAEGRLDAVKVLKSSGSPEVDAAAVQAITAIGQAPTPPAGPITVRVPFNLSLVD